MRLSQKYGTDDGSTELSLKYGQLALKYGSWRISNLLPKTVCSSVRYFCDLLWTDFYYSIVNMPARTGLGELELLVLLALARLDDGGYGVSIRDEIRRRTGRSISPGAIYPTLDRLERKGFVRSKMGAPEPVPGGRAKRHFTVCPAGVREARRAWKQYATLARGIAALEPGRSS